MPRKPPRTPSTRPPTPRTRISDCSASRETERPVLRGRSFLLPLFLPLPASGRTVRGKSYIGEPQLIGREVGFWLAWIHWRRSVDFCDRFSHEQALADEFSEAKDRHPQ